MGRTYGGEEGAGDHHGGRRGCDVDVGDLVYLLAEVQRARDLELLAVF